MCIRDSVTPSSTTSSTSGNSETPTISRPISSTRSARISRSSTTLWALRVASTIFVTRGPSLEDLRKSHQLQRGELGATAGGQVEQRVEHVPVERLGLGRALDLDKGASPRQDHVHVGVCSGVLRVVQVPVSYTHLTL